MSSSLVSSTSDLAEYGFIVAEPVETGKNRPRKSSTTRKKKTPPKPRVPRMNSYPVGMLVDEFTDTVNFADSAFRGYEPSLQLGDFLLVSPKLNVGSASDPVGPSVSEKVDPLSTNTNGTNADLFGDSRSRADVFLFKQRNGPTVEIPLSPAGDAVVANMLRDAMVEMCSNKLGETEWRKKNEWIINWRKLRYPDSQISAEKMKVIALENVLDYDNCEEDPVHDSVIRESDLKNKVEGVPDLTLSSEPVCSGSISNSFAANDALSNGYEYSEGIRSVTGHSIATQQIDGEISISNTELTYESSTQDSRALKKITNDVSFSSPVSAAPLNAQRRASRRIKEDHKSLISQNGASHENSKSELVAEIPDKTPRVSYNEELLEPFSPVNTPVNGSLTSKTKRRSKTKIATGRCAKRSRSRKNNAPSSCNNASLGDSPDPPDCPAASQPIVLDLDLSENIPTDVKVTTFEKNTAVSPECTSPEAVTVDLSSSQRDGSHTTDDSSGCKQKKEDPPCSLPLRLVSCCQKHFCNFGLHGHAFPACSLGNAGSVASPHSSGCLQLMNCFNVRNACSNSSIDMDRKQPCLNRCICAPSNHAAQPSVGSPSSHFPCMPVPPQCHSSISSTSLPSCMHSQPNVACHSTVPSHFACMCTHALHCQAIPPLPPTCLFAGCCHPSSAFQPLRPSYSCCNSGKFIPKVDILTGCGQCFRQPVMPGTTQGNSPDPKGHACNCSVPTPTDKDENTTGVSNDDCLKYVNESTNLDENDCYIVENTSLSSRVPPVQVEKRSCGTDTTDLRKTTKILQETVVMGPNCVRSTEVAPQTLLRNPKYQSPSSPDVIFKRKIQSSYAPLENTERPSDSVGWMSSSAVTARQLASATALHVGPSTTCAQRGLSVINVSQSGPPSQATDRGQSIYQDVMETLDSVIISSDDEDLAAFAYNVEEAV